MVKSEKSTNWGRMILLAGLMIFLTAFPALVSAQPSTGVIKLGIIGPMKFETGENLWVGAKIATDEINASGGALVGKRKHMIELVKGDTNEFQSITDAVATVERIITVDKVNFLLGGFRTDAQLGMQDVIAEHHKILILPGGSSPKLVERVAKEYAKYKYYFILGSPTSEYQGHVTWSLTGLIADKIRKELGIAKPKVALVIEKAVWTQSILEGAQTFFPQMGMEIVGSWSPAVFAKDLKAELTSIKNLGAHIIFGISSGPNGVVLSKQWGELKIPAALVGLNSEGIRRKNWDATGGMCEYETVMNWVAPIKITEKTIPFYNKFLKEKEDYPMYNAGGIYDSLNILKEAVERAGTLDSDSVVVEIEKLEKTPYIGTMGRNVLVPKDHRLRHSIMPGPGYVTCLGTQWRNKTLVTVWPDGNPFHPVIAADLSRLYPVKDFVNKRERFEGTTDYQLPPWMIKYWKKTN